jgi:endonuclease/exonuclease/phosphatase family metal-dependent hydrolase
MTRLDVFLLNYERGGKKPDGFYDLEPLGRAVALASPHLVVLNEAAGYAFRGGRMLYQAANTLTRHTRKVFVPLLCWTDRGDYPPAIFYQPEHIEVDQHFGTHADDPGQLRNLVVVTLRADGTKLRLLPIHFDPQSGLKRLLEAEDIGWACDPDHRTIVAGDFNSISSGKHDLTPDFDSHPLHKRTDKGLWVPHDDLRHGDPTPARWTGSWTTDCTTWPISPTPKERGPSRPTCPRSTKASMATARCASTAFSCPRP